MTAAVWLFIGMVVWIAYRLACIAHDRAQR